MGLSLKCDEMLARLSIDTIFIGKENKIILLIFYGLRICCYLLTIRSFTGKEDLEWCQSKGI